MQSLDCGRRAFAVHEVGNVGVLRIAHARLLRIFDKATAQPPS